MNHVVPMFRRIFQVGSPFIEGAHPFGDDGEDDETIERERDIFG